MPQPNRLFVINGRPLNLFQIIIMICLGIVLLPIAIVGAVIFGIYVFIMQWRLKRKLRQEFEKMQAYEANQDQSNDEKNSDTEHGRIIDQ